MILNAFKKRTPAAEPPRPGPRFDAAMLTSLIAAGFLWLFLLAPPWTGALGTFLVGGTYVVLGSLAMGAVYARERLLAQHEMLLLLGLWLGAVLTWASLVTVSGIVSDGSDPVSSLCFGIWFGLWIGTPTFVMWQVLALVLRGFRCRARRSLGADA